MQSCQNCDKSHEVSLVAAMVKREMKAEAVEGWKGEKSLTSKWVKLYETVMAEIVVAKCVNRRKHELMNSLLAQKWQNPQSLS